MKKLQYLLLGALVMLSAACQEEEPLVIAPTAVTGNATDIYRLGATLSGNIQNPHGASVKEYGIHFSELESMAEYTVVRASNIDVNSFSIPVASLSPGKTYYYRAYASSGASSVNGSVKNFTTTQSNAPVFGDVRISKLTEQSVTVSTEVLDEGGSDLVLSGFCWMTGDGVPTVQNNVVNAIPSGITLQAVVNGLIPGQIYSIRPYGVNGTGVGYGPTVTVVTQEATVPVLSKIEASDSTEVSVTVKASIVDEGMGEITKFGFCYSSESKTPTTSHLVVENVHGSPTSEYFAAIIEGLDFETTYYIRAYAENEIGTGYSDVYVFTSKKPTEPGIYSLEDLVAFRNETNIGADLSRWISSDGAVHIYNDIDASSIDNWIPINEVNDFAIEGQGHTITLKKTTVEEDVHNWGFVLTNNGATIVNLNINLDMQITDYPSSTDGNRMVKQYASVCVYNKGYISNCSAMVNVVDNYGAIEFGGIACINRSTIENCNTRGNITNGIIVGGIAAQNHAIIASCKNYASLINDGGDAVGGIAGYNGSFAGISGCINSGAIKISNPNKGLYGVGGIVGRMFNGVVENSQNEAPIEVLNADAVGGIVGNAGEVLSTESEDSRYIEQCRNSASIVGPGGVTGNMIGVLGGVGSEWDTMGYGGTVNGATGTEENAIGKDIRWGENHGGNSNASIDDIPTEDW